MELLAFVLVLMALGALGGWAAGSWWTLLVPWVLLAGLGVLIGVSGDYEGEAGLAAFFVLLIGTACALAMTAAVAAGVAIRRMARSAAPSEPETAHEWLARPEALPPRREGW